MLRFITFVLLMFGFAGIADSLVDYSGPQTELADSGKSLTDSGRKVKVFGLATLTNGKSKMPLKLTGSGVRWKTVAIMDVNVYAAAHYLDASTHMNPSNPLEAVAASNGKVLQMTFFRSLTSKEIGEALKSALEKNGVDLKAPHLKDFFSQFEFAVSPGETLTLIGIKGANGEEEVIAEAPGKVIRGKGKNIATDIWKGYFGTPIDKGLEDLKKKLSGAP